MPQQLDPKEKKKIFNALKKIKPAILKSALMQAALNNEEFPVESEEFSKLCDLRFNITVPAAKPPLTDAIEAYLNNKLFDLFQDKLTMPFDEKKWTSSFLCFLAKELDIQFKEPPLVNVAMKDGKIYWRIIQGDKVLYDRTLDKSPSSGFDFSTAQTFSMTWQKFRTFKDGGKRFGSVAITKERFVKQFKYRPLIAAEIWDELKEKKILDHNDRLSQIWHFTSSSDITLDDKRIAYKDICSAFYRIIDNPDNAEKFSEIPGASIYRPDRSKKEWMTTGRIKGLRPKSKDYKVMQWDVGTYQYLNNHATSNDGLHHDHEPSVCFLKKFQSTIKLNFEETPNTKVWIDKACLETSENWSTIAVPESLHTLSNSYKKSSTAQQATILAPFQDEMKTYLNLLESATEHKAQDQDEYLKALGAFRYMYRCQVKGKHGKVPYLFFREEVKKTEIDELFKERLDKSLQYT